MSWLDASAAVALSRDGRQILIDEHGEGGGSTHAAYLRPIDGSPAIRLGVDRPLALSADGRSVLVTTPGPPLRLDLLPTGAGETGTLDAGALQSVHAASWFPRGDRLLLAATEPGQGSRLYVQPLDGRAESMTPEGFTFYGDALAPDGKRIAAVGPRDQPVLWNIPDGVGRDIPGLASGDIPIGWSADGTTLYVARRGELPARVDAVDLQTGQKRLWKTFMPPDPAGVGAISSILVSADACSSG